MLVEVPLFEISLAEIFTQNSQLSEKSPPENSILHPEVFLAVMVAGDAIVKRAMSLVIFAVLKFYLSIKSKSPSTPHS